MNNLRLAIISNEGYFADFTDGCAAGLGNLGFTVRLLDELPADGDWDAILVVGIHKFPDVPCYRKTVLLGVQTEQLPLMQSSDRRLNRNLKRFRAVCGFYNRLFEWNPSLYTAGVGGDVFLPYGCRSQFGFDTEKVHDVLFIGNLGGSQRRNELLTSLANQFNFYPDYSPGFGVRKAEAIRGSRICINIHYYTGCGFEAPRVFDYLSCGAFVLSERVISTYPFIVGRDLEDYSGANELACKIAYYLEHDEERQAIAKQGFQTASNYSYDLVSRIIAMEVGRASDSSKGKVSRLLSWNLARARSDYFRFRDYLSTKRRGVPG